MAMNNSRLFSSSWIGEKMNECHKSPPSPQSRVLADCKLPFTRSNCCCATAIKKRDLKVVRDFRAFLRWGFFFSLSTDCSDAFQQIIICGQRNVNIFCAPEKLQGFLKQKTLKGKIFFAFHLIFAFTSYSISGLKWNNKNIFSYQNKLWGTL